MYFNHSFSSQILPRSLLVRGKICVYFLFSVLRFWLKLCMWSVSEFIFLSVLLCLKMWFSWRHPPLLAVTIVWLWGWSGYNIYHQVNCQGQFSWAGCPNIYSLLKLPQLEEGWCSQAQGSSLLPWWTSKLILKLSSTCLHYPAHGSCCRPNFL